MLLVLAANVWLPWTFARLWADPFLFFAWPVLWGASVLLPPLACWPHVVDVALHRLAGRKRPAPDEESFEEDIRTIVSEGHREGLLEEEAREMIEGVIELGDADVSQIMTPRTDMVSLPAALSWEEMLQQVINAGHTRIPVYGRNRDDILGILHTKDLLARVGPPARQRAEPWTKLLRQPVFVPETKPIDALLQELQRGRNHMVVVLDEYGGVSGLVTIEDVLEEIVGEIADEYDPAHVEGIRDLGPGVCEALGRVHIDEINERLGLGLPEDADYDTIGGFVFNELGHIPTAGEDLVWQNVRITVLDATRRRIERVRIEVLNAAGLPTPRRPDAPVPQERKMGERNICRKPVPACGACRSQERDKITFPRHITLSKEFFMLRFHGLLLIAFLASGLWASVPARAASPGVTDQAGFFSKEIAEQETAKLRDIFNRYNVGKS